MTKSRHIGPPPGSLAVLPLVPLAGHPYPLGFGSPVVGMGLDIALAGPIPDLTEKLVAAGEPVEPEVGFAVGTNILEWVAAPAVSSLSG